MSSANQSIFISEALIEHLACGRYYFKNLGGKTDNNDHSNNAFNLWDMVLPISEGCYEGEMCMKTQYICKHFINVNSFAHLWFSSSVLCIQKYLWKNNSPKYSFSKKKLVILKKKKLGKGFPWPVCRPFLPCRVCGIYSLIWDFSPRLDPLRSK